MSTVCEFGGADAVFRDHCRSAVKPRRPRAEQACSPWFEARYRRIAECCAPEDGDV